jgi:hypothetical protein
MVVKIDISYPYSHKFSLKLSPQTKTNKEINKQQRKKMQILICILPPQTKTNKLIINILIVPELIKKNCIMSDFVT